MKHHIKKIITTPKHSITIAVIIAMVIGVTFYYVQNNSRAKLFENLPSIDSSSTSIVAQKDLTLAFLSSGRIKDIKVKIGDFVKAGTVLAELDSENAVGAVNQAQGAYQVAQTNYQKLLNGASDTDIQIARVALSNAKTNYDNIVSQQKTLVASALSNLYNSGLIAQPIINNASVAYSPIISGTYTSDKEGTYTITVNSTATGYYFTYSGLENGTGQVGTLPSPLGTKGLYLQFPSGFNTNINNIWTITIPNTQSPTYLQNLNAYNTALQNQTQTIASAQGAIDSAQANLDQKVAKARIEDLEIAKAQVESTQGALQVAESAYNNTIITAPVDGIIENITMSPGQIAGANTPIIELLAK